MYSFLTSCVNVSNGDDINDMSSIAVDIPAEEFLKLAEDFGFKDSLLEDLGYNSWANDADKSAEDLFCNDFGINTCESRFQGISTLYVRHSGIEHIYIPNTEFKKYLHEEEDSVARKDIIESLCENYEDLFFYGLKNDNVIQDLDNFISKNESILIQHNIPLTTMATEFSNYNSSFLDLLRDKEEEYLPARVYKEEATLEDVELTQHSKLKI